MMDRAKTFRKWVPVVLTAGIGVVASMILFQVVGEYERTVFLAEFERRAEQRISIMQAELADHITFIDGLGGLYAASHNVERFEFHYYLNASLHHVHTAAHATAWVPRVPHAERRAYEDAARKDGLTGFYFTEQAADGTFVPALVREVYFPLYYVGPEASHKALLGFDLTSEEQLHGVLARSRDTATINASLSFEFSALDKDQRVFMVVRPIYMQDTPTATVEQRRANFKGNIVAFFRMKDVVNDVLERMPTADLHFLIREGAAPPANGHLYFHISREEAAAQALPQLLGEYKLTFDIKLHGLKWSVDFWPSSVFLDTQRVWAQWLALISGILMTALAGTLISLSIIKRDQIQKAKASAEVSEIKYRALLDQAPDAILLATPDERLIEVNTKAEELFGYDRQELLAKPLWELHPEAEVNRLKTAFQTIVDTGKAEVLNSTLLRKDGSPLPIDISGTLVRFGNEIIIQGIFHDITARKDMEKNLLQAQKLSALAHMISGIAHELNNMLVPIVSLTSITAKHLPEDSRDRARLIKATEAAERASQTVQKLVAFTRWGEPKFENLLITTFVNDVIEQLRSTIPSSITVNSDIEDCDAVIHGDRNQLQSVFFNIVDNAVDAMQGRNGDLILNMATIEFTEKNGQIGPNIEPGRYVLLTIQDCGIGIDADTVTKVFDPFFTTKPVGQGTGLGLATAYGVVSHHGGTIVVKSVPGQGSTFEVYLPVVEIKEQ